MTYTITSKDYPDYKVTVEGPYVIAYGVAKAINKQEKIDVSIVVHDETIVTFTA